MNVLLIDDDILYTMLMGSMMDDIDVIGHHTIKNNGLHGLLYLEDCAANNTFPDLILVDLKMPEMDGYEFIQHYSQKYWKKFPLTKIIVLTSSVSVKDKDKVAQFEAVSLMIIKPLTEERILDIIQEVYHEEKYNAK